VPTVRRTRELSAAPADVWAVLRDPHHLPRWWPRVQRVEDVSQDHWTAVLATKRGKGVRADYRLLTSVRERSRSWEQEVADSPFERLLREAVTSVAVEPAARGTRVTLELRQRMRGLNRLGGFLLRRASRGQLDEALEGLERVCAR
jgi:uncharacterized protein YndB with AHSA1/START domain